MHFCDLEEAEMKEAFVRKHGSLDTLISADAVSELIRDFGEDVLPMRINEILGDKDEVTVDWAKFGDPSFFFFLVSVRIYFGSKIWPYLGRRRRIRSRHARPARQPGFP